MKISERQSTEVPENLLKINILSGNISVKFLQQVLLMIIKKYCTLSNTQDFHENNSFSITPQIRSILLSYFFCNLTKFNPKKSLKRSL